MFQERKARPRKFKPGERLALLALGHFFNWREVLTIVKPGTFINWHRTAFRVFWSWKLRKRGRPVLRQNLQELIRNMAAANPSWGEERIADELLVKLGIRFRRAPSANTLIRSGRITGLPANVGPRSCETKPRASSPVTPGFRLPRRCACCTSSSRWRSVRGGFCIPTSPRIPMPSGPSSNSASDWPSTIRTSS